EAAAQVLDRRGADGTLDIEHDRLARCGSPVGWSGRLGHGGKRADEKKSGQEKCGEAVGRGAIGRRARAIHWSVTVWRHALWPVGRHLSALGRIDGTARHRGTFPRHGRERAPGKGARYSDGLTLSCRGWTAAGRARA